MDGNIFKVYKMPLLFYPTQFRQFYSYICLKRWKNSQQKQFTLYFWGQNFKLVVVLHVILIRKISWFGRLKNGINTALPKQDIDSMALCLVADQWNLCQLQQVFKRLEYHSISVQGKSLLHTYLCNVLCRFSKQSCNGVSFFSPFESTAGGEGSLWKRTVLCKNSKQPWKNNPIPIWNWLMWL